MSFFPPITSIQDYNQWATGCGCDCALPGCAEPVIECKSISSRASLCGLAPVSYPWAGTSEMPCDLRLFGFFKKLRNISYTSRSNVGSIRLEDLRTWSRSEQNVCSSTFEVVDGWDAGEVSPGTAGIIFNPTEFTQGPLAGGGYFFKRTITGTQIGGGATYISEQEVQYTDSVSDRNTELVSVTNNLIANKKANPEFAATGLFTGENCTAGFIVHADTSLCATISPPQPVDITRTHVDFRWTVPPEHEGSYYRIDWDEVFFPKAFLDWQNNPAGPPPVLPTLTPKSWEWTGTALGPCCGEETDTYEDRLADETRKSPWGVMPPPDEAGEKQICNVRVLCYRSAYTKLPWLVDGFPVIDLESYEQP